jgi:GNAT superfamily N-acetyltransferase
VSDLTLRRYRPGDADAVRHLHERALRHAGAYDEAYAHLDADLDDVTGEYLEAGGEFLVGVIDDDGDADREDTAESDRDLVAMGAIQPSDRVEHHETDPGTAVVRRIRVDPARHRQGYGSTVLAALEERAAELGFDRLVLDTTTRQRAACGLFEAAGYVAVRRVETAAAAVRFFEKDVDRTA